MRRYLKSLGEDLAAFEEQFVEGLVFAPFVVGLGFLVWCIVLAAGRSVR
jgi:hypothetical protein